MNSTERHEARYQRRKAKREAKRRELLAAYGFERVADTRSLFRASQQARSGVYWKASVQRYNMNLLRNAVHTRRALEAGTDIRKGFIEFDIVERGKPRHIRSVHFSERVVQRSLCDNALIPLLSHGLIYDNGASLEGKGIDFAMRRMKAHLRRHYRQHGAAGYILLIDFKGYFDNILHEPILDTYRAKFEGDDRLIALAWSFVTAFGEKGLGLGSETSQINAISYPNPIDHYIKEVLRCPYYGRYMDDSYIICESKERLQEILDALLVKYAALGIRANPKKTQIVKLSRGFTFLKAHFNLEENGHIVVRPCRESVNRQRRKLKSFKWFYDAGEMTLDQVRNSYMSWRGYIGHKNARRTIWNMDRLYQKLFGVSPVMKNYKEETRQ